MSTQLTGMYTSDNNNTASQVTEKKNTSMGPNKHTSFSKYNQTLPRNFNVKDHQTL